MNKYWKTGIFGFSAITVVFGVAMLLVFSSASSEEQNDASQNNYLVAQLPENIPPEALDFLEEKGINLEDIKDNPEQIEKLKNEFMQGMLEGKGARSEDLKKKIKEKLQKDAEGGEGKPVKRKQRGGRGKKGSGDGDMGGYKVIVEKNLFRPLGSGGEKKGPAFTLLGTIIAKGENTDKAIILQHAKNETYYVAVGEKVGQATVMEIAEKSVKLDKKGEEISLQVKNMAFLGGKGGGKGGKGGGKGGGASPSKNVSSSKGGGDKPSGDMRDRFRNMSPDERRKAMQQFMQDQGGRGGRRGSRGGRSRGGGGQRRRR